MNIFVFMSILFIIAILIVTIFMIVLNADRHDKDDFKVNTTVKFTKCDQCGSRVYLGDLECPVCGKKVNIISAVVSDDAKQYARKEFDHIVLEKKTDKEKEKKGWIATTLSVVIAISVILQFLMIFID